MRRVPVLALLTVLLLLGLTSTSPSRHSTLAQEATPEDDEFALPEGISFEFIAFGELPAEMEPQAELSMYRISFEPGTGFPPSAADPTTSLVFVERGALTITLDVPVQVLRAIGEGTPFPELAEEIPAGTEFMLNLGDSILVPSGSTGEVMNNGTETAIVLIAELAPEDAFDDEDGTPEP